MAAHSEVVRSVPPDVEDGTHQRRSISEWTTVVNRKESARGVEHGRSNVGTRDEEDHTSKANNDTNTQRIKLIN